MSETQSELGFELPGQKYVLMDAEGYPLGFWTDWLHTEKGAIPPEAIKISDKIWDRWAAAGRTLRWQGGKLVPAPVPVAPPIRIMIEPSAVWLRCTDAEAEKLDALLRAEPIRIQRLWSSASIEPAATEFDHLRGQMDEAFGKPRTAELLAP